jgi:hypothetical protein
MLQRSEDKAPHRIVHPSSVIRTAKSTVYGSIPFRIMRSNLDIDVPLDVL